MKKTDSEVGEEGEGGVAGVKGTQQKATIVKTSPEKESRVKPSKQLKGNTTQKPRPRGKQCIRSQEERKNGGTRAAPTGEGTEIRGIRRARQGTRRWGGRP